MSQPYIGEIRSSGIQFRAHRVGLLQRRTHGHIPKCGAVQLIGTTYGGDGQSTFGLPNLQGRVPIHVGSNGVSTYVEGQIGGAETVTVLTNQIPGHTHPPMASASGGTSDTPANSVWADWTGAQYNNQQPTTAAMRSDAVGPAGGSQPHDNMIPFLAISFVIALEGIFPSQN